MRAEAAWSPAAVHELQCLHLVLGAGCSVRQGLSALPHQAAKGCSC